MSKSVQFWYGVKEIPISQTCKSFYDMFVSTQINIISQTSVKSVNPKVYTTSSLSFNAQALCTQVSSESIKRN